MVAVADIIFVNVVIVVVNVIVISDVIVLSDVIVVSDVISANKRIVCSLGVTSYNFCSCFTVFLLLLLSLTVLLF